MPITFKTVYQPTKPEAKMEWLDELLTAQTKTQFGAGRGLKYLRAC